MFSFMSFGIRQSRFRPSQRLLADCAPLTFVNSKKLALDKLCLLYLLANLKGTESYMCMKAQVRSRYFFFLKMAYLHGKSLTLV